MKLSYKKTIVAFFILYLAPIIVMGYFVSRRIQMRQVTTQLFLQNQVDVDRQILAAREYLRDAQTNLRQVILGKRSAAEKQDLISKIKDNREKFDKFWQKYEANYMAKDRPFLKNILAEMQELNLVEEEERLVKDIRVKADAYFNFTSSHPLLRNEPNLGLDENLTFLDSLLEKRDAAFISLNNLADIRYIYAQRIVFFISSENSAQQGVFYTIFIAIILSIFIVAIIEYFILLRPLGDIMLFLSDLSQGKRGQRLYFSSPVKEIKQSEDVINKFVDEAEEREKDGREK